MRVDLHIHTNCSDGAYSPSQIVTNASLCGLQLISITDHDTINAFAEAEKVAQQLKIHIVSGVEISSMHFGTEVHILGYNVDTTDPKLINKLNEANDFRYRRNQLIVDKLNQLGMNISIEELYSIKDSTIGRPHIAKLLVKYGYVSNTKEAFDVYLKKDAKAYVNAQRLTPKEAIEAINVSNGIAVLAHPSTLKDSISDMDSFICELATFGLRGIEADYFSHTNAERTMFRRLATKYDLIVTGGSDYHSNSQGVMLGAGTVELSKQTLKLLGVK